MLTILRSPYLSGPAWIIALVAMFAVLDVFLMRYRLNLGRLPMPIKVLYLRVLAFELMPISDRHWRLARRPRLDKWLMGILEYKLTMWKYGRQFGKLGLVGGGATIVSTRSGLLFKNNPGGLPSIQDTKFVSGNIFFVDSGTLQGGTTSGFGSHPDEAITDIESAYDLVTASQGDLVLVLPGHAETLTDEITMDQPGISVVGMGVGLARPTITQAVAGDAIAMDANSNVVENLFFNEATVAPGAGGAAIDMNAADCQVRGCHFDLGADDLEAITITATGDRVTIEENAFYVTANGPVAGIEIEASGAAGIKILRNYFDGGNDTNAWDTGAINSGVAHTRCLVEGNRTLFGPGIIFSAAATGTIAHNFCAEGVLGSMIDTGACMAFENYEADAVDESGRLFPTSAAS